MAQTLLRLIAGVCFAFFGAMGIGIYLAFIGGIFGALAYGGWQAFHILTAIFGG